MDALLEALAKLLRVFTEPVQVLFLLVVIGLSFACWKLVAFLKDNYVRAIEADLKNAAATENLVLFLKEKLK